MQTKQRGFISGVYPKRPKAAVEMEGLRVLLSIGEVLKALGPHGLDGYSSNKTFSILSPKWMSRDQALELLRKKSFIVKEDAREVCIEIVDKTRLEILAPQKQLSDPTRLSIYIGYGIALFPKELLKLHLEQMKKGSSPIAESVILIAIEKIRGL